MKQFEKLLSLNIEINMEPKISNPTVGDRFYTLAGRAEKKGLNWILGRQCLHRGVQLEAMMQIWQANPVEPRETKPFTVGAGTLRWFYCIACEMRNKTMSSLDLRFFFGFLGLVKRSVAMRFDPRGGDMLGICNLFYIFFCWNRKEVVNLLPKPDGFSNLNLFLLLVFFSLAFSCQTFEK